MQHIYNHNPEINHVSRVYIVAAILYLQFVLHVMLFHILRMFWTSKLVLSEVCMCVMSNVAVFFCTSLI